MRIQLANMCFLCLYMIVVDDEDVDDNDMFEYHPDEESFTVENVAGGKKRCISLEQKQKVIDYIDGGNKRSFDAAARRFSYVNKNDRNCVKRWREETANGIPMNQFCLLFDTRTNPLPLALFFYHLIIFFSFGMCVMLFRW